jgi:hypothetical protein
MKKYYPLVRKLHLYFGLFISPFVLIFSISVLVFNHAGLLSHADPVKALPDVRTKLDTIPFDTFDLGTARAITRKLNISGEIDFISKNEQEISFPVNKPGLRTLVRVNTQNDSVLITRQQEGALRGMAYLHAMPGQHNVKIRGNSGFLKLWRVLADAVVYLLLLLTVSGMFLWYFLKVERSMGYYAMALGALLFAGLLLLIF